MANDARFEVYPQVRRHHSAEGEDLGVMPTGEFGWRFRDANGRITFIGGEGFTRRQDAHRALNGAVYDVLRVVLGQRIGLDVAITAVDADK